MANRLCICTNCANHASHQAIYPKTTAPGQRCPPCQQAADASRPSRQTRGYDRHHELTRQALIAQWEPGQPCAIGGEPTWNPDQLDLAHNQTRTGYLGLACHTHNRGHHD